MRQGFTEFALNSRGIFKAGLTASLVGTVDKLMPLHYPAANRRSEPGSILDRERAHGGCTPTHPRSTAAEYARSNGISRASAPFPFVRVGGALCIVGSPSTAARQCPMQFTLEGMNKLTISQFGGVRAYFLRFFLLLLS